MPLTVMVDRPLPMSGGRTVGRSSSHRTMEGADPAFPFIDGAFSPIPVTTAIVASGSAVRSLPQHEQQGRIHVPGKQALRGARRRQNHAGRSGCQRYNCRSFVNPRMPQDGQRTAKKRKLFHASLTDCNSAIFLLEQNNQSISFGIVNNIDI